VPTLTGAQLRELERLHARLLAAVASGRGTAIAESNAAWHWAIYDAARFAQLSEFIRRLWDAFPWRTMWALPGRTEQSVAEHEAVMEAIRAGDAALAVERLRSHIATGERSLLDRLERERSEDATSVAAGQ
jgi:DNA-binding GntR family transcriptional regulator